MSNLNTSLLGDESQNFVCTLRGGIGVEHCEYRPVRPLGGSEAADGDLEWGRNGIKEETNSTILVDTKVSPREIVLFHFYSPRILLLTDCRHRPSAKDR